MAHRRHASRVTRTGLAIVHEGEVVLPAAGSEAQAAEVIASDQTTIHFHFPVVIEVVAGPEPADPDALADLVLERLARALENQ